MNELIVTLVEGVSLGGILTLVSLGIVLAFRATGVFNFAYGNMMFVGAFLVGMWQADGRFSALVSVIVSLFVVAAIGGIFYAVVLRRTVGLPPFMQLVTTFGLAFILTGLSNVIFSEQEYVVKVPGVSDHVISLGGAHISVGLIVTTVISFVLAAVIALVLRFTHLGIRIRASGQDPTPRT